MDLFDTIFNNTADTYNKECVNKYNRIYGFVDENMKYAKRAGDKDKSTRIAARCFIHLYDYIIKQQSLPKVVKGV